LTSVWTFRILSPSKSKIEALFFQIWLQGQIFQQEAARETNQGNINAEARKPSREADSLKGQDSLILVTVSLYKEDDGISQCSREVSHVQKFTKQAGWPRRNGAAASLGGSGLK
jgi:hypothetical protein